MRKLIWPVSLCLGILPALAAGVFHVNPPKLPDATVGKVYAGGPLVLQGGGECPRNIPSVRVVTGALPPGMYLSEAGQFGGAPMEAGRYEFVVRVENGCGWSDQPMTIESIGAPFLLANPAAIEFRVAPGQAVALGPVQVSGNSPGLPYSVESSEPWLRVRARAGRIPAAGSALAADLVDVEIDTATLGPGVHRAEIDIGGWRMAQAVRVPVRVEVLGAVPAAAQSALSEGDPRLPSIAFGPNEAAATFHGAVAGGGGHTDPAAMAHAPSGTPPGQGRAPAPMPGRISRSAQLRSKYLAAKAAPTPAAAHPPAPAPAAAAAAKPSPVGEPVKKAERGKPAEEHGKPADAHGKPAPAAAKPAETHGKPADEHSKPAEAHGKPADAHGKPAETHGKAKEAPRH